MPPMLTVDVLIPVYRPGKQLEQLLERLHAQNCPIGKIILMNTEKAYFPEDLEHRYENLEVQPWSWETTMRPTWSWTVRSRSSRSGS